MPEINAQLSEKWVIITGAAGGVGGGLTRALEMSGYKTIGIDIAEKPKSLCCTHYIKADLRKVATSENYAKKLFSKINGWTGNSDLVALINNAAVQILGDVSNLSRRDWQISLNVNLVAPFILAQGLLQKLELTRGHIVNISSIHAELTKKNFLVYATTKAALSGLTRAMAIDLGQRVRVIGIEPAAIDTKMLKDGFKNKKDLNALIHAHPSNSIGTVDEIANIVNFIISSNGNFLHGSIIDFSGGISHLLHE